MINNIYSVRDEASTFYMGLQLDAADAVAIRNFDYACSTNDIMKFRPEDFSLWQIGSFDDTTGIITPIDPRLIKRGVKPRGK